MPRKKKHEKANVDVNGETIPKFKKSLLDMPHEFPQSIVDSIAENSPEGFLLFVLNENGEVQHFASNKVTAAQTGLRNQAMKMLTAVEEVEYQNIGEQIFNQMMEEGMGEMPEDEDFDEE